MITSSFNDYDIIVIGSGIGGLVCATKLARHGLRVAVFEQHYKPGGYCTDFSRKGFRFDAAVHFIGGCQRGGIIGNILDDLGLTNDIEFVRVDPIFRVVTQEDDFRLPGDLNEFFNYLKLRFPAEQAGLENFAELIRNTWNETAVLLEAPAEKTFSLSIKSQYVAKIITQTFQAILDDHFSSSKLKALLSLFCTYGGLPPNRMSGMYMMAILGSYLCQGTYYPYGGSQEFANILVRGLTRSGGVLHLRKNVSKILLSNRACGFEYRCISLVQRFDWKRLYQ
jgi:phytoene dehydrogenase-like protein